jgi:hypothetical protein
MALFDGQIQTIARQTRLLDIITKSTNPQSYFKLILCEKGGAFFAPLSRALRNHAEGA